MKKKSESTIFEMLSFVFKRVAKEWKVLLISIAALVLIAVVEFKIPQITQQIIDVVVPSKSKSLLFKSIGMLAFFTIALNLLSVISTYLMSKISQQAVVSLRQDLYSHVLKQDLAYFENQKTGDLMTRLTSDVRTIQDLISPSTLRIFSNIVTFVLVLGFLMYTDWKLSLLILITFPMLFLVNDYFSKRMKANFRRVRESVASLNNHLQTTLTSVLMIKNSATEGYERSRFEDLNAEVKANQLTATKTQALFSPSMDMINFLGTAIVLTYGTLQIFAGNLTVGAMMSYLAYLKLLQNPIRSITSMISRFQQALVSYERLMDIHESEPTINDAEDASPLTDLHQGVTFDHVSFEYQTGKKVLNDVSFEIPKGKLIALVGSSGSGKTTVTKLLSRLYEPTAGEIMIDNIPLNRIAIESLRQGIGVVSQDVELIDGTVRENVTYGIPGKTPEEVQTAIDAAKLSEFVTDLPEGLETQIGERGVKLSGGQKQRISIARVFLKNAPILILDEATAALDNESERFIQKSLEELLEQKTALVIAHRLSTIHNADTILVMEKGEIIESGNHQELIEQGGKYQSLYDAQFS
ncbi:ABC transporter ATP-binding protein [Vagococcus coleopterorum]|uniref:Multidrug resistance ABC transporter ATP-binding and permease protein n=1 Tax=Vagococcus coleopterorum TaxID=2714946 RepID=A0A6G8AM06_9ENTE|nr:ABC transporter ATP-binding protein [Vagococcus coleopterorum]QIL46111.1 ABC transporter ATP-binding protein [Vagococcus coleopterorum]